MQMPSQHSSAAPHRQPLVSVLMSVYNGEKYLPEAVDSILAQSMTDFELIVVDDGSRDKSWEIVQMFMARDKRVKGFTQQNTGVARAMNAALKLCTGKFIAKMDADDVAAPYRFQVELNYLQNNPDVVAVGSDWEVIDSEGRKLTVLRPPTQNEEIQKQLIGGHCPFCHSTAMMRHEALIKVGGYTADIKWAEDLDVFLKLGEVGKLANLSRPLVKYRVHENSVSSKNRAEQEQMARLSVERAWQRRGIQNGTFEARPWRAGEDADSRQKYMLRYGWWAFNSGERATAMYYARRALRLRPFHPGGWKLLLAAALRSPVRQGDESPSTSLRRTA